MKKSRNTNFRVGLTILVAFFIIVFIIVWAKNFSIASNTYILKINFNNVAGLLVGDNVSFNGVKVGRVKEIIIQDNQVVVEAEISSDIKLKNDAIAYVEMMDLMGGKKIEIYNGSSTIYFDHVKDLLKGKVGTDVPGALKILGNIENDIKNLMSETNTLLSSLNSGIKEYKLIEKANTSLTDLSVLLSMLRNTYSKNDEKINNILTNTDNLTKNLSNFSDNNLGKFEQFINESDDLIKQINITVKTINEFLEKTKSKDNNIGKVLYDEKLFNNFDQSLEKLNKLTDIILKQLDSSGVKVEAKIKLR